MKLHPVMICAEDDDGVTVCATHLFPSTEEALKCVRDFHEEYAKRVQTGVRRSAIINQQSKKEWKQCPNRN
jgi:hypothetical protein